MKLKDFLIKVLLEEEDVKTQHDFLKNIGEQSYYLLLTFFKLKVLYNKEACDKNAWKHWYFDEFIGNALHHCIIYFKGKVTKEDIIRHCMMNYDNNYKRLKKDTLDYYKKIVTVSDYEPEKIKKLAIECYSRFADYIINSREELKNFSDYKKAANYILNIKEEN